MRHVVVPDELRREDLTEAELDQLLEAYLRALEEQAAAILGQGAPPPRVRTVVN